MIEMADKSKKGEVNEADFLEVMEYCGLIPEPYVEETESEKGMGSSFERALE